MTASLASEEASFLSFPNLLASSCVPYHIKPNDPHSNHYIQVVGQQIWSPHLRQVV